MLSLPAEACGQRFPATPENKQKRLDGKEPAKRKESSDIVLAPMCKHLAEHESDSLVQDRSVLDMCPIVPIEYI